MIYIEDKNIIVVTPPHTASRNIHRALGSEAYWVIGEDPFEEDGINHHCTKIHKAWIRRKIIGEPLSIYIVCRDPYTRLVGLFLHHEWSQEKGLSQRYLCWEEFVYNRDNLNWMFNKTISQFISASGLENYEIIVYEKIEEELSNILETKISLPPRYHDPIKFEEWYYDSTLLKHVNETWAKDDCELFGYPVRKA